MGSMKGLAAVLGVAVLMVVVAACGNGDEVPTQAPPTVGPTTPTVSIPPATPIVSHGGPVKDYVGLVDDLRAAGATVDPAGTKSAGFLAPEKQSLTVNGESVSAFEFGGAEEAVAAAEGVSADGTSILTTMADGTRSVSAVDWVAPSHFYKAGKLIVIYVGCDSDVISLLQETMGPQFAGGAGLSQCPDQVPPTTMEIGQALEAADGSEVRVSGFFFADKDGNARLCSGLLESFPPQCGGDRIELLGFDANSVPNTSIPQTPSEIRTARWTDRQITVTGIKRIGGLVEVRISTDVPPAANLGGTSVAPPAVTGMIVPDLRLTFEDVEYTGVEILGAASPNRPIVCCGTPINTDDMEVVGTGIQHNPDGDATVQVYRPKADGTTDVYTFHPSEKLSRAEGRPPEDETDAVPATWTRWTAK